jgi:Multiubiquitin
MEAAIRTNKGHGPSYFVEVDGAEVEFDHEPVSGGEIMDEAGIPREQGLLELLDDGTQRQVGVEEDVELKPGKRFKKRPRFRRG